MMIKNSRFVSNGWAAYGKIVEIDETKDLRANRKKQRIISDGWTSYCKIVEIDETEDIWRENAQTSKFTDGWAAYGKIVEIDETESVTSGATWRKLCQTAGRFMTMKVIYRAQSIEATWSARKNQSAQTPFQELFTASHINDGKN
ncbi:hypothetical protein CAEBREN_20595 [Caenorhabditis brenneri]|uniref:Uncharacterized protein n=1 Tax=Caenorhabditis brenneri TaxID=135651 RepID=G0NI86_CAEBE|nr:hypothetical protein CAEBREN_20595 [Caenorhabditis brenneri]